MLKTGRVCFCNGERASATQQAKFGQINYGHFTTVLIQQGAVRGVEHHLCRLRHATAVLFGADLDCSMVRSYIRRGFRSSGLRRARLRITVCSLQHGASLVPVPKVDVFLHFAPLAHSSPPPLTIQTQYHQRDLPAIKHLATFASYFYQRRARAAGFDDVLFMTAQDLVAEGSFWNIGFWDGRAVVWPQAPILAGTSQALLDEGFRAMDIETRASPIHRNEIGRFCAAFSCNALGYRSIRLIDQHVFSCDALTPLLNTAIDQTPWQPL